MDDNTFTNFESIAKLLENLQSASNHGLSSFDENTNPPADDISPWNPITSTSAPGSSFTPRVVTPAIPIGTDSFDISGDGQNYGSQPPPTYNFVHPALSGAASAQGRGHSPSAGGSQLHTPTQHSMLSSNTNEIKTPSRLSAAAPPPSYEQALPKAQANFSASSTPSAQHPATYTTNSVWQQQPPTQPQPQSQSLKQPQLQPQQQPQQAQAWNPMEQYAQHPPQMASQPQFAYMSTPDGRLVLVQTTPQMFAQQQQQQPQQQQHQQVPHQQQQQQQQVFFSPQFQPRMAPQAQQFAMQGQQMHPQAIPMMPSQQGMGGFAQLVQLPDGRLAQVVSSQALQGSGVSSPPAYNVSANAQPYATYMMNPQQQQQHSQQHVQQLQQFAFGQQQQQHQLPVVLPSQPSAAVYHPATGYVPGLHPALEKDDSSRATSHASHLQAPPPPQLRQNSMHATPPQQASEREVMPTVTLTPGTVLSHGIPTYPTGIRVPSQYAPSDELSAVSNGASDSAAKSTTTTHTMSPSSNAAPSGDTYTCPICKRSDFSSEFVLRSHLRAKHDGDEVADRMEASVGMASSVEAYVPQFLSQCIRGGSFPVDKLHEIFLERIGRFEGQCSPQRFVEVLKQSSRVLLFMYSPDDIQQHNINAAICPPGQLRVALSNSNYTAADACVQSTMLKDYMGTSDSAMWPTHEAI